MKVRCSEETPRCANCLRRGRPCTYPTVGVSARSERVSDDAPSLFGSDSAVSIPACEQHYARLHDAGAVPPEPVVDELIDQYFSRLHSLPAYSFLHEETVKRRNRERTINDALKLSLCAITALVLGRHEAERDGWARESERQILDQLDEPSIFHLQALLLVIRYRAETAKSRRAFMLAGLAARSAVALRLNYEHPELGPVAQEVRRRTFWSLYLLEDVFCVGLKEFELCRPEIIQLQLPCADIDFGNERETVTGFLQPGMGLEPETLCVRGLFVKLAFTRRSIMKLNRQLYLNEIDLPGLFRAIEHLQSDLRRISSQIAPEDGYPPTSTTAIGLRPQYIMMHMSYRQCQCDLYRIFLSGYPEAAPQRNIEGIKARNIATMRHRCLKSAQEILDILFYYDSQTDTGQVLDFDAAVCTYHAARLVLFGAFSGKGGIDISMEAAIDHAQRSVDIISRRFAFSAAVEPMRDDLSKLIERYRGLIRSSSSEGVYAVDQGPRAQPGVSKAAIIRQRLSVHSLLLRSDFVDDSREAATEPPRDVISGPPLDQPPDWAGPSPATGYLSAAHQQEWIQPPTLLPSQASFPDPGLIGMYDGASIDFSVWSLFPAIFEGMGTGNSVGGEDEQYMY
ncbi:fungal-specific transcription factor domain-containing protein [Chaetomium strumarium]|uniref:Fungal-specific transcription factor domain-containing protein n=1 Tax=Chaetomium strumarium TaxID=1170767 RepID=A0AAJ0LYY7_9PEZI|nr:fungal-specific transcription factor domain-containing protein [Chaetomium strumarium]